MRHLPLILIAGCSFTGRGIPSDETGIDATISVDTTAIDEGPTVDVSLVAAYAFDETSNNEVVDASTYGNRGRLFNGPGVGPAKHGNGLVLNGAGQYMQVDDSPSLDIAGTGLTISFWAQLDGAGIEDDVLVGKFYQNGSLIAPYYQYGVEFDDNDTDALHFYFTDTDGLQHGPHQMPVPLETLVHVTWTYDGAAVKGYVNSVLQVDIPASGAIGARGQLLRLGLDAIASQPFRGVLDDVRIYNRPLPATEIVRDMNTPIAAF